MGTDGIDLFTFMVYYNSAESSDLGQIYFYLVV